jgi:hypothetical protein
MGRQRFRPPPRSGKDSSVAAFPVDLLVAGTAQAHEVRLVVRAAFREGNDVVDFLDRNISSVLQALLAEGMLVDVARADALPCLPYRLPGE